MSLPEESRMNGLLGRAQTHSVSPPIRHHHPHRNCQHRDGCTHARFAAVKLDAGGQCTVKRTLKFTKFVFSHIKNKLKSTSCDSVKRKGFFGIRSKTEVDIRAINIYMKLSLSQLWRQRPIIASLLTGFIVHSFHTIVSPGSWHTFCNYIWLTERPDQEKGSNGGKKF